MFNLLKWFTVLKCLNYFLISKFFNLEDLETICNEGKFIPIYIPNIEKLVNTYNEAKILNTKLIGTLV